MWSTRRERLAVIVAVLLLGCSSESGPQGPAGPDGTTAGPAGATGAAGATGPNGALGPQGPNGASSPIVGTVTAAATGKPLGNVAIQGAPGALAATTAADGTFTLPDLLPGAYTLTFVRAGYVDKVVPAVSVVRTGPTNLAVTLDTDAKSDGPTLEVSDNLLAGFGTPVTISAKATDADSDVSKLTYAWTQIGGLPATLSGAATNAISFTTLAFTDAKPGLTGRFGMLGFDPDETGAYVFQLTATDPEGHATTVTVKAAATAPTTSLGVLPLGIPAWLQGDGAPQTTWSWALDVSLVQGGSTAKLTGATTQFPSFTPDRPGTYKITESVSGKTLTMHGGTWLGINGADSGCRTCHNDTQAPDKFTPWSGTKHASTLQRGLDGAFGPDFSPACLGCHSVGTSSLASNGGFDDVMASSKWPWPSKLAPGNWSALASSHPELARLGSVQCESCHGPQSSDAHPFDHTARISWGEEVCASCHGSAPFNYKPAQWKASKHADPSLALRFGTVESRPNGGAAHCGRCHTAQGYAQYTDQLRIGYTGNLTKDGKALAADKSNAADDTYLASIGLTNATVQPQTCAACHDPHDATNPAQLRIYDAAPGGLPSGQGAITAAGKGMVCMACHNSRNGELDDFTPAPAAISGPHDGPQTDVLYGFNAYFMPRMTPSPHLAVKDTCVGCHYGVPTASQASAHQTSNHSFAADLTICSSCHASDVNAAAIQSGVAARLDDLDAAIYAKVKSALAGAVTAYAGYKVRIVDPATGYTSSWVASGTAPSTVTLAAAPASIDRPRPVPQHGGLTTLVFTMSAPVTFEAYDSSGADKGPLSLTTFNVSLTGVQANGAALFPGSTIVAKAIWNEQLLHNDGTLGVHNRPFYAGVIDATIAKLQTLP